MSACSVDGCERPFLARGFCRLHYTRAFIAARGDVGGPDLFKPHIGRTQCAVEGCSKPRGSHQGFCKTHASRWLRHGSVEPRFGPREHGEFRTYAHGCRCDLCRAASRERQHRVLTALKAHVERAPHGTESAYRNWGCRCEPCKVAGAVATYKRRHKTAA